MGRTSHRFGCWGTNGFGYCSRNRGIERVRRGECVLHRRFEGFEEAEKLWTVAEVELESLTSRHLIEFRHCVEESRPVVVKKLDGAIGGFNCGLSREEVMMEVDEVLMNF